ncbi:MAG: ABC transporter ATP-binding protein/permease [bacterium]|nr:ABC transporter ATP-binding protein/permease [bacterium]
MQEKKYSNFIRFLGYVRPYTKYIVLGVIGGIVKFSVPLLMPQIIRHLIDGVFLSKTMTAAQKLHELYYYVFGMIGIYVVIYAPWTYMRHYFTAKAGHQSVFDLRCELYYRILRMSASFFKRNKSGGIVSRLISDVELAQNLVGSALTNIWMDGAALFVVIYFLLRIDVRTTLVALATFPIYLYFFRKLGHEIKSMSYQVQKEIAEISGNVNEKISGSAVVHAFNQEKRESKRFKQDSDHLFSTVMRRIFYQSTNVTVTGVLTALAPMLVYLYGGYQVIQGHLRVGDLVAVGMYLGPLYLPLQRFSELNIIFANSMAALDRIFEIMDEKPDIADRPGALELEDIRGEVRFERVCFAYDEGVPVLRDIDFAARPGQRVALVGPSGSGKSTLVSLIPRFYDPARGAVRIDDHDVRDIGVKSLRRHIGMVLQDPILFSGTIRDNILYGNPHARPEEVRRACESANALGFIEELPGGLETEVGERGNSLSGGQKQRLTIARAFLKNPRILILDEPTSALDSESERLIQEALGRLMLGRTTFIIAHRLSTVTNADMILVMQNGRIVEEGRHDDLLRSGRVYRRLYEQQFVSARSAWDRLDGIPGEDGDTATEDDRTAQKVG